MEIFKSLFKKWSNTEYKNSTLNDIRKNLDEYSRKRISIIECVSEIGPLTTELILMDISVKNEKKDLYDSILIMISNYYIMLHMHMYTGFYLVNRQHICDLVAGLVKDVLEDLLKEPSRKQRGLKSTDYDTAIQLSREFAMQLVEEYYRGGIEGCHRYISSSVYSVLLSENKNLSVKPEYIEESLVRSIQAYKYLTIDIDAKQFSNNMTG
ncbi:MAG: hypothetical protein JJU13_15275 [Balneolaceae bacterium]|nr:hypothetical protein [Balneolaceae bacterium]